MFVLLGIFGILLFLLVRPQELNPAWAASLPTLNSFALLAVLGLLLDVRRLNSHAKVPPQTPFVLAYLGWCFLSLIPTRPDTLQGALFSLLILFLIYFLIGFGCQSFRKLGIVATTYLVCALFITVVANGQGLGSRECFEEDPKSVGDIEARRPDGRPCEFAFDCRGEEAEPGKSYTCAKRGPFETSAVGDRVRYIGRLNDPNEMSLCIGIAAPFALVLYELRRSLRRWLVMIASIASIGLAVYFSQSRGGQLVFAAVFATYLYRRSGWKGLVVAAFLATPMMLFGGRSGDEAEGSSKERLECWLTGMELFRASPIYGIGAYRFTDHHFLTAHNSYVLAAAETGFPGLWLFVSVLFISLKSVVAGMSLYDDPRGGEHADLDRMRKSWGVALLAALVGGMVGIFFLSFAYHFVLWILLGIAAAYWGAVKAHRPSLEVTIGRRDYYWITVITVTLIVVLYFYTRLKAP